METTPEAYIAEEIIAAELKARARTSTTIMTHLSAHSRLYILKSAVCIWAE